MPKIFVKICFVNLALLLLYSVLSYFEWNGLLGIPLVSAINWTLLRTQIWFGGTVPDIVDGLVWINHWSLITIIAIIIVNLVVIWKIEQRIVKK